MDIGLTIRTIGKEERRITQTSGHHLKVEHLSFKNNVRMMLVELPPGASIGEVPHAHEGEEVHVVIKGRIYAEQGEDTAEFGEGDSFSWNACTPHLVRNISEDIAIVLNSIYTETDQPRDLL